MSILGNAMDFLRAYVSGTDSNRVSETNHLSAQYVSELLVSSAALVVAGSPYYYPSAAGGAQAGFKDISFDFYLVGNAGGAGTTITMTVEATSDDVTPYWHDVTMAGYELVTNAIGVGSYAAVGAAVSQGILDFDELNVKLWRIKLVVSGVGAQNCTARIYSRRKAL